MSSADGDLREHLDVTHGEQLMVHVPQGENLCTHLPRRAYDNLLVLSTGRQPNRIDAALRDLGVDPSEVGVIPITGSDVRYDGPLWVTERVAPGDLTGISIAFSRAMEYVSADGWVCFDAVSVLAMYAEEDALYRLLGNLVHDVDERGATGIYTFVEGTLDDESLSAFRTLFDREVAVGPDDLA